MTAIEAIPTRRSKKSRALRSIRPVCPVGAAIIKLAVGRNDFLADLLADQLGMSETRLRAIITGAVVPNALFMRRIAKLYSLTDRQVARLAGGEGWRGKLADELRAKIKASGKTVGAVAEEAGLTRRQLARLRSGETTRPRRSTLAKIEAVL